MVFCFLIAAVLVLPKLARMDVLTVHTGSMAPAIRAGDAVLVRPVLSADLRENDVVVYRPPDNPGVLVTHRIVAIRYEQGPSGGYGDYVVTTKGDNNPTADSPWRAAPNDVFGKVLVTFPKLGHLQTFFSGARGKVLAVVAFVLFVVAGSVSRRRARQATAGIESPAL